MLSSRALLTVCCLACVAPFCGAAEFYVAPQGDDANAGSAQKPFATLTRARDAVRELLTRNGVPPDGVTVTLRGGEYRLTQTLELGAADSGTDKAPVIWRAAPNESVSLLGGVRLTGFHPVSDEAILSRLAPEARGRVLATDLKALGVTDFGEIGPASGRRAELFMDHTYMTLARYPNEGWLRIASVPQEGELKFPGDFRDSQPTMIGGKLAGKHYGRFCYDGDRPARWTSPADLWVHGYWVWDFSDQYQQVERLDATRREVWPKPPYHFYGYHENARYYFLNVLEELDQPGEWYLDRATGVLYFWAPGDAATAVISFPVLGEPLLSLKDASYVQIVGMTLECSRAGAVVIRGGARNLVAGCTVRNVADTGITVEGGVGHGVRSCDLYELGAGGVSITAGDRKTLTPGECFVENCHIHDFGRVTPTYRPAVSLNGVGQRVSHCYIHDCPHQGLGYAGNDHVIEFCEFARTGTDAGDVGTIGTGMDWTYMGQEIRCNYFHDIHSPERVHVGSMTVYLDLPCGGAHIHGNVFRDMQRAFFTNSGRDCLIENNIFVRCAPSIQFNAWWDAGMFKPGGSWRLVERLGEVNYDQPPYGVRYPGLLRLFKDGDPSIPTGNLVRRNISVGGCFLDLAPNVSFADVRVENNLIADPVVFIGSPTGDGKGSRYVNGDEQIAQALAKAGNVIVAGNPGLGDVEAEDFSVAPDSPAWKLGFEPIPSARMGLQLDEHRKVLPVADPVISPASRSFFDTQQVSIRASARTPGSVIRYTLDGSEPTASSTVYAEPLTVTRTTVLRAVAFSPAGAKGGRSPGVTARYTAAQRQPDGSVYLSDLPALDVFCYGELKRDHNYFGGTIRLSGREYQRGVMICPQVTQQGGRGQVTYLLEGGLSTSRRFRAVVGVEDEAHKDHQGSAAFIVEVRRAGKWETCYESKALKLDETANVEADITGADQLRLVTTDGGDTIYSDYAVWAEARIE